MSKKRGQYTNRIKVLPLDILKRVIENAYTSEKNDEGDDDDDCHGNNNGGTSIYLTGLYVGNTVKADGNNIYWNTYNCVASSNREVVAEVTRAKALASVLARITVLDKSGNKVELEALRPQEAPEAPAAE